MVSFNNIIINNLFFKASVGYHSTKNASETKTAISLHLYSPPYLECSNGTSIMPGNKNIIIFLIRMNSCLLFFYWV